MPEDNNPIPQWHRQDLPPMLTRRFEFETYAETRHFLDGIAKLAEEARLYPNLSFGKTYVSANLLRHWRRDGLAVAALKPVMSGFDPAQLGASDAGQLLLALDAPMDAGGLNLISPWRFAAPLSPDMAAAREGKTIPYDKLVDACRAVAGMMPEEGRLIIEGVGGRRFPRAYTGVSARRAVA